MANFKNITTVPTSTDLIDIVLNKTQRKTPTVIHPTYHISKIRVFYTKKVIFTSKEFTSRLSFIVSQFPFLESIHPFYNDLINVLYDRDHFKMALGHINLTKKLVEKVGNDYIKLIKYSETLYRAKSLKRAALGKMATIIKKLGKSLEYLEEVRQHLSRLPSIDPSSLSIILCGYPNVGKSSFINKVSRANVDVQPFAFTTKNLFVGHFDYDYLRWQVIDTPGILDHKIDEMNLVEMQTITALAHIKAVVLFFIDLSGQCGFSVDEQIGLCESLEPILGDFIVVLSKCDTFDFNLQNINDNASLKNQNEPVFSEENLKNELLKIENIKNDEESLNKCISFLSKRKFMKSSSLTNENIEYVKKIACQSLLQKRIEKKTDTDKIKEFINRIKIIKPLKTHPQLNSLFRKKDDYDEIELEKDKYEKDRKNYVFDERQDYLCDDKYDIVPEFYYGKNIADFIDPDIEEKLRKIEEEEEKIIGDEKNKKIYDIFTKDEREYVDTLRIRKREREIVKSEKVRSTIPVSWVENRNIIRKSDEEINEEKNKRLERLSRMPKVVIEKGTFRKIKNERYFDAKPKHIYRSSSKKGARRK